RLARNTSSQFLSPPKKWSVLTCTSGNCFWKRATASSTAASCGGVPPLRPNVTVPDTLAGVAALPPTPQAARPRPPVRATAPPATRRRVRPTLKTRVGMGCHLLVGRVVGTVALESYVLPRGARVPTEGPTEYRMYTRVPKGCVATAARPAAP